MPKEELDSRDLVRGDISDIALVELLGNAYARGFTGKLELVNGSRRKQIFFLHGLPIFVSSEGGEGLIEVARQVKGLSAEDTMQLVTMQKEKGLSDEQVLHLVGLFDDAGLYALQIEHFMQLFLEACGWREGRYRFVGGDDVVSEVALFDLNPLEMIYQGIKTFHSLDLGARLEAVQSQKARLNHGWEKNFSLPRAYFHHSHLLDMFEPGMRVSDGIGRLFGELQDISESMLFIYMLLVTGVLELAEEAEPEEAPVFPEIEILSDEDVVEPGSAGKEVVPQASVEGVSGEAGPFRHEDREDEDSRLLRQIWSRYLEVSRRLDSSADYFEWLGLNMDSDFDAIRQAFSRIRDSISLAGTPLSVQKELAPYQKNLKEELDRAYQAITDPDKRLEYEIPIYNRMLRDCADSGAREELAARQWQRGMWYLNSANRPDLARYCFQKAEELDRQKPHYPAYMGWAIYLNSKNERDRQESRNYLERAIALDPCYDQANYFLGVIHKREGGQEKALEYFQKAIESNPENTQAERELHLIRSQARQSGLFKRLFGKPA